MTKSVAVLDSGSGNLRSVQRALAAVGAAPILTSDPDVVAAADRIVVPGQGAFGDCMHNLRERGLEQAITEVIQSGRPYLGICLGLQILFETSEESPGVSGLALLPGSVKRFDTSVGKVPHMGWNSVEHMGEPDPLLDGIFDDTYYYFIHSYYVHPANHSVSALECDYSGPFTAAIRKDNLFGCQFHPEKSQGAGLKLLENFTKA